MSLTLRARGPSGVSTIKLAKEATAGDLTTELVKQSGLTRGAFEVRSGFPPKPLDLSVESASLASLGVSGGDTLTLTPCEPAAVASPAVVQPASTSSRPSAPASNGNAASSVSAPISTTASKPGTKSVSTRFGDGRLVLRQVPDDNSCMFHAASLVVTPGRPDGAAHLRKVVTDAIKADPVEFNDAVLGQDSSSYCLRMLKPATWGGAIELRALSQAFQTEVASVDVQTGRIDRFGEGQFATRVLLVYQGVHYDALSMSLSDDTAATWPYANDALAFDVLNFPTDDDSVLIAAQEIANQLRATHQYTDTANFTLKCGECGEGLRGEKEARAHAQSTGHSSFTEYS